MRGFDLWLNQAPEPNAVDAGCHRATGSAIASVKPRGATITCRCSTQTVSGPVYTA